MERLIQTWRDIVNANAPTWVLFENGTCVFLAESTDEPVKRAMALLQVPEAGEDSVWEHPLGYLVSAASPWVATFVELDEVDPGAVGRLRRQQDANSLAVTHIEHRPHVGQFSIQFKEALLRPYKEGLHQLFGSQAEHRVTALILKQAVKDGARQIELQPSLPKGRVSFLKEDSWRLVMTPPLEFFPIAAAGLRSLAGIGANDRKGRLEFVQPQGRTATFELSLWDTDCGEALKLTAV